MTSSKSLRASLLPSSISPSSVQRQHSPPPSPASTETDTPKRWTPPRKASYDFFPNRNRVSPRRACHAHAHSPVKPGIEYDLPKDVPPSPPRDMTNNTTTTTKSRKWGERLSSLLPMLTSSPTGHSVSSSIRRKPVALTTPDKVSPTETATPPPPYDEHDLKPSPTLDPLDTPVTTDSERGPTPPSVSVSESNSGNDFRLSNGFALPPLSVDVLQSATMPILRTEMAHSALGIEEHPQIASATSSSPNADFESQVPVLQELAPQGSTSRNGSTDESSGELRGPRKLRKNSGSPKRPRANSYQPGPSVPLPGIRASSAMPPADMRGRSVSSHPNLSVTEVGAPPPMPPPPVPRPTSRGPSPKNGSQSPSRGRIRKSWMPGGRSRSNSVDVMSPAAKMQAWIMTEENTSEYNPSLLKNAEKVS